MQWRNIASGNGKCKAKSLHNLSGLHIPVQPFFSLKKGERKTVMSGSQFIIKNGRFIQCFAGKALCQSYIRMDKTKTTSFMKKISSRSFGVKLTYFVSPLVIFYFFTLFCSFKSQQMADDFLKQLGITKVQADDKITNSIIGGSLDIYGVKNAKNIAVGNRKAVVLDMLGYVKKHVSSASFIKEYTALRNQHQPKEDIAETPEQMKAANIARAKQSVVEMKDYLKKADASMKAIYEKSVQDAEKYLKEAEDPNNRQYLRYAKNYEQLVKSFKEDYTLRMADWEKKYPANHLLYVKKRLQQFMDVTANIDFDAELVARNNKKVFVQQEYERKDNRWKMAFRAGREVVEPARSFVEKWMSEIN